MAKKKQVAEDAQTKSVIDQTLAELEARYGKVCTSGQAVVDRPRMVIPTSPNLDAALGGGIPEGSWVSLVGMEKTGKTTTALSFSANCQKPEYGSRPIIYHAVESRLKSRDLRGIRGLDLSPSKFHVVESKKGHILTAQEHLEIAERFITDVPGCVLILDSVSALLNPRVQEDGVGTADYGSVHKLMAQFIDRMTPVVPINDCIIIGIVHFYANVNRTGNGPTKVEKSASRWRYQADVILNTRYAGPWLIDPKVKESQRIGQIINWTVVTSAIGPPGGKAETYLRYGLGIDSLWESILCGGSTGTLKENSSWFTLEFLKDKPELLKGTDLEGKAEPKLQGVKQVYQFLRDNPKCEQVLNEELRKMVAA